MPKPRSTKSETIEKHLSRIELNSVRLSLLVALWIAGHLAWGALRGGSVPGCGPESDCDKVLGSRWAYVRGIPISLFAMPIYLLALIFTFPQPIPWRSLLPLAGMILVGAVWFVGLQVFAIGAFCKFCMAAHAAGIIAAALVIRRNPLVRADRVVAGGIALTLGVILALVQITSPTPAPRHVPLGDQIHPSPDRSANSNRVSAPTNALDPIFPIVRGQFNLDLRNVPVTGSLAAPKRMVKLFDYTCHHCRDLHHLLEPVVRKYSNELAIVSLPMPLDASCNPVLRSTAAAHANACEYARVALAVYFAEPAKFHEFSNWLFKPERPPEVDSAKEIAASMVGRERFEAALRDARIEVQIRMNCSIYAASSQLGKSGAMPQLIFPTGVSIGAVSTAEQLEKILADALALRPTGTNQPNASASSMR